MFDQLEAIYYRPRPFEFYTADELWTDEHTSAQMLAYHLNEEVDLASRSGAFIDRSVEWLASHLPRFVVSVFSMRRHNSEPWPVSPPGSDEPDVTEC